MMQDASRWQQELNRRPWWISLLLVWSALLTFVWIPGDLFLRPVVDDVEVWFGLEFTGWVAKASGVLHWAILAAGTWGFWKMRPWMWPWASLYVGQVAFSHLVWSEWSEHGRGWPIGLLQATAILVVAVALWRARPLFQKGEGVEGFPSQA